MVWNKDTPEYQDYVKYPRVAGGPTIGLWFLLNDAVSINAVHIESVENDAKEGVIIRTASGQVYHTTKQFLSFWQKLTTMDPAQAEQLHYQQKGLARANGPIGVVR